MQQQINTKKAACNKSLYDKSACRSKRKKLFLNCAFITVMTEDQPNPATHNGVNLTELCYISFLLSQQPKDGNPLSTLQRKLIIHKLV